MCRILTLTPFGFVLELEEEGCFTTKKPYTLSINGEPVRTNNELVLCVFGLCPDTDYHLVFEGLQHTSELHIRTEPCEFLINIKDYNAAGDGTCSDTAAIQAAIYAAPEHSVIIFPRGEYLVEHIFLKSNLDYYLEEGAVLRQNPDRNTLAILKGYQKNYHYTNATVNASWEGNPLDSFCSLLYGKNIENVRIYGKGTLNGSGAEGDWWQNPKVKNRAYRPRNLSLFQCRNITVSGLTSENSAAWNIHPFTSENLAFYGLTIKSNPNSPNTDGLNPESCENVTIAGCHFQVGDDCIAIKSGKFYMSRRHYRPSKNIFIRHCFMEEGHGGVVIGSEISCGVQNVHVERCYFLNTDRGLRIKTRRGRGDTSVVDGIHFSHVQMDSVRHCFVINMFYHCDPDGHSKYVSSKQPLPVDESTPTVQNITITNVTANDISGSAVFLYGLPERNIQHISIEHSRFSFSNNRVLECPDMMDDPIKIPKLGIFARNIGGLQMQQNQWIGEHVIELEQSEDSI